MKKRVFIKTYGCQMNERDSEQVAVGLKSRGYELVDSENSADIVLLNTCSVREQAEQKAIGKAGHLLSNKKNSKHFILGIMGCMAQNRGGQLVNTLPDLNLVVGTQKFHRVADYLDELLTKDPTERELFLDLDEEPESERHIKNHLTSKKSKVSAFVSIMQGCNMNCSFCIVPKTRGKERYRPISEIVEEVTMLVANGVREVTLLGQIVNAYGRGEFKRINNKTPFVQLLEKLNEINGLERIRFTSPHPISFGEDLIYAFSYLEKLGSYTHLPMQSGSNKILKSMNRPYTRERFLSLVSKLRSANKDMRLSTDVIVGYPGEDDEDFELTKSAFIESGFEMAFIFKYSERSGTPAAEFADKIPQIIKEERNQQLLKLLNKQSLNSNLELIGKVLKVLVEGHARKGEGNLMGRSACFRKVVFSAGDEVIGNVVNIHIEEATANTLFGKII